MVGCSCFYYGVVVWVLIAWFDSMTTPPIKETMSVLDKILNEGEAVYHFNGKRLLIQRIKGDANNMIMIQFATFHKHGLVKHESRRYLKLEHSSLLQSRINEAKKELQYLLGKL